MNRMRHTIKTSAGGFECTCGASWAVGDSGMAEEASMAMRHADEANGLPRRQSEIDPREVLAIIADRDRLTRERFAVEARMHELREESDRITRDFQAVNVQLHDALGATPDDLSTPVAQIAEGYGVKAQ